MDVLPEIIFIDDGVYCLISHQKTEAEGPVSFGERLRTLADLVGLHAVSDSLNERRLNASDLNEEYKAKIISLDEAARMIERNEAVITF